MFAERTNDKDGRIGKYIVAITTQLHKMIMSAAPQYPCKKTMLHVIAICALRLRVKALPNYEVVAP